MNKKPTPLEDYIERRLMEFVTIVLSSAALGAFVPKFGFLDWVTLVLVAQAVCFWKVYLFLGYCAYRGRRYFKDQQR